MTDFIEPLERPPGKEGDDSVNTPLDVPEVEDGDLEDTGALKDDDDDE